MKLVGRIRSEPQAEVLVNLLGVFPYEAIGTRWHNVVNRHNSHCWGTVKTKNDLFLVSIWKNEDAIFLGLLHEFEKYIESRHVQVGFNKPHELIHVVFRLN